MKKEKAPKEANIFTNNDGKDKNNSTLYKTFKILESGQRVTAMALNIAVGFNDARKAISLLRQRKFPVEDFEIKGGRKVYYFPEDWQAIMAGAKRIDKQLNLFNHV